MKVETFYYQQQSGWSVDAFPAMDSPHTAVFVFGDSHHLDDDSPIAEVAAAYPNSHLLGCSTSGEILEAHLHDNGVAVAVVQFDQTPLQSASTSVQDASGSHDAGLALARALPEQDLRGVIVFSDGHDVNGSELIRGLRTILPDSVVITGGLAGDGDRFQRTWVLRQGRPAQRHIQALGLYGDHVRIGHGSEGGWDVFGPERLVTESSGNVLAKLDNEPALTLYKKYLGDEALGLPATALLYPLAVRDEDGYTIVRTVLAVDEEKQTLTFAGDIPTGSRARFMMANNDRLVEGAAQSARNTCRICGPEDPVFALAVSCVGRRLVLGERTEEELEAVLDVLPRGSAMVGFYSYGEISPSGVGPCALHNQTMTLTAISEAGERDAQAA